MWQPETHIKSCDNVRSKYQICFPTSAYQTVVIADHDSGSLAVVSTRQSVRMDVLWRTKCHIQKNKKRKRREIDCFAAGHRAPKSRRNWRNAEIVGVLQSLLEKATQTALNEGCPLVVRVLSLYIGAQNINFETQISSSGNFSFWKHHKHSFMNARDNNWQFVSVVNRVNK